MLRLTALINCVFTFQAIATNIVHEQIVVRSKHPQQTSCTLPVAAAWLYMSDNQEYNTTPSKWWDIDFTVVDVLYVGPAGIQEGGIFGLFDSDKTGPLGNRFEWVLKEARSQNPDIKIVISQWWGIGLPENWGSALSALNDSAAINKYAESVASFLKDWSSVAGGVDGYDVDYEDNNVVDISPAILSKVRSRLDALSDELDGRYFYITVSPSETEYLDRAATLINYVNIQTYQGGFGLSTDNFLEIGFDSHQLLYGYCPESGCGPPTLNEVKHAYDKDKQGGRALAGIHLYRLNSDNSEYEIEQQEKVYKFLHSG